jgi:predicted flap endonuclease-1-like 5' DNA nuclease
VYFFFAFLVAVAFWLLGYALGRARRLPSVASNASRAASTGIAEAAEAKLAYRLPASMPPPGATEDRLIAERARIIRGFEAETAALRRNLVRREASIEGLQALAGEREALFATLASARAETARYRQLVIDLENNAPPPLLDGPGTPDDLKLIVGIGPVLERMLYQLGVNSYRQIARWSERDVDEFDARLPEFPGRIRRDAWVTQARELYASKYGGAPWDRR